MAHITDETTDRLMLKRAIYESDTDAQGWLYAKYKLFLINYLRHTRNVDGFAEDIAQEVFLRICGSECAYDGTTPVRAYLRGMAKHILSDRRQSQKRTAGFLQNLKPSYAVLLTPLGVLEKTECRRILRENIAKLPPKSRQAVNLVYIEGIPAKQAAKRIGCEFKIFRDRLQYSRTCLRKLLKQYHD